MISHIKTNKGRARLLAALVAPLMLAVCLLPVQVSYAFDDDKNGQDIIEFVKIDENGEMIDGATFRFSSSDGKGVRHGGFDTSTEITQTQKTYGLAPSAFNYMSAISLQAHHQWFGVNHPDGSTDGGAPFREITAYLILEETAAPAGYALAAPVTIRYAGSTTQETYPYLNYSIEVIGDGGSKKFSSTDGDYKMPVSLSEDPGGVANAAYKQKYANNRRNWPDFLIIDYPAVKIAKKDTGGAYLKGAVLEITGTTAKGHAITKKTITSSTEAITLGLPSGTYKLHEVTPPEGYELVDDIEFEVKDGVVSVITRTTGADGQETVEKKAVDEVAMVDPKKEEPEEPKKPLLSIKKTSDVKTAKPGDVIPYTVTITNKGEGDADEVIALDIMGDNLTYVSDDANGTVEGQTVTWHVKMPAGTTKTIHINCRINESAVGKVINNVEITNVEEAYLEPEGDQDEFTVVLSEYTPKKTAKTTGTKTGDAGHPAGLLTLLLLSGGALGALANRRKKSA